MASCKNCRKSEATVPEGEPRYCETCWEVRLKQLFQAEDRFRAQRVMRTSEAEKHFVFHDSVKTDDGLCAVVFCMHDSTADHLDISAYLLDVLPWSESVPIIYQEGVESEFDMLEVFLGFVEGDIIGSWRTRSWAAEITRCAGSPIWIESRERPRPGEDEEPGET